MLEIYRLLVEKRLSSARSLEAAYELEEVGGLDTVRTLCGPDDSLGTPVYEIEAGDDCVLVKIITTAAGHRLELTSEQVSAAQAVTDAMGLEFSTR